MDKEFWQQWKFKMWLIPLFVIPVLGLAIGGFAFLFFTHKFQFLDYVGTLTLLLMCIGLIMHWISELRAYRKGMKNPRTRPFLTEWTKK